MHYHLDSLKDLRIDLSHGTIVFLKWDLWSWKTTFVKNILQNQFWISESITSPTYTYYNKYGDNIYHFDLYRLWKYDEFFAIWWEEVLDSWSICFIEWPEILEEHYTADIEIILNKLDDEMLRDIEIKYKK